MDSIFRKMNIKEGPGSIVIRTGILIAVIFFLNGSCVAGDRHAFSISTLSVADKLLGFVEEDFNQDGFEDILIIHRKGLQPDETRWVSIFWQKGGEGFSTAADQSWEIDTLAVLLDVGDVEGDTKTEICYLTCSGVHYYPINGNRFITESRKLIDCEGLTVFPSKRSIPLINFVRDWNDDGDEEVGVFRFGGLSIFAPDSSGEFRCENRISIELKTSMSARGVMDDMEQTLGLRASFSFPETRLIDYNGDGLEDLIATRSDRVIVYLQDSLRSFTSEPVADVMFDVRTQKEKIDDSAFAVTVVKDLDNDGFADAIVTKQSAKGLSNFRCAINIYYGGPEGYANKPDQVIISEGSASERTIVRDVNGDGRLDMILPSIKISIRSIIRFLLTKSIPINFNIFLLHEDGRYSDRPDFSKAVKFKIDFSGDTDTQAISLSGDFNGDKRKDFVFGTREDELSIYMGTSDGKNHLFSRKPVIKLDVPAFGVLHSCDLNGDGFSDMIMSYPQNKERQGTILVFINQKKLD